MGVMGALRSMGKMGNASLDGSDGSAALDREDGSAALYILENIIYCFIFQEQGGVERCLLFAF